MPVVQLEWTEHLSPEKKREFVSMAAECVARNIRISSEFVNVFIREASPENAHFPGAVLNISWYKSPDRSKAAKAGIVSELTGQILAITNIPQRKIVFFFHDLDPENVGFSGSLRE